MRVVSSQQRMGKAALNEADACRTLITPKVQAAGWENEPHSIAKQRTFTDGSILPRPFSAFALLKSIREIMRLID
jgi:hypothetical protein